MRWYSPSKRSLASRDRMRRTISTYSRDTRSGLPYGRPCPPSPPWVPAYPMFSASRIPVPPRSPPSSRSKEAGSSRVPSRVAMVVRVRKAVLAGPVAAAAVVATQVLRASRRPDLPTYPNQDPSGRFGDPSLPGLRIVALGDSSITAPGVADLDTVWIRRVAHALSDRYHVDLVSLAVGGGKGRDVLEGQLAAAIRVRPDVAGAWVGRRHALGGIPS